MAWSAPPEQSQPHSTGNIPSPRENKDGNWFWLGSIIQFLPKVQTVHISSRCRLNWWHIFVLMRQEFNPETRHFQIPKGHYWWHTGADRQGQNLPGTSRRIQGVIVRIEAWRSQISTWKTDTNPDSRKTPVVIQYQNVSTLQVSILVHGWVSG